MFSIKDLEIEVGGKKIRFETGKIGRQAGGSVVVTQGETTVFCTACSANEPSLQIDFSPLRIDYQEKFSSAGRTLGGFIKREGRPTEKEILTSRLIDRPIRPLFPEGFSYEVQLLSYVWSYDGIHAPDVLAICGASAALMISDIPFKKPIAGVRVGYINGQFIVNPSMPEMEKSRLDLVLAGTENAILMIEGHANFLSEDEMIQAVETGHKAIKEICCSIKEWAVKVGKPKSNKPLFLIPQNTLQAVKEVCLKELEQVLSITAKQERAEAEALVKSKVMQKLCPDGDESKYKISDVKTSFKRVTAEVMRKIIVEKNIRCDGRKSTDIRPIHIESSILPRVHGSALFTRGETQSVAVCTLGGENMGQRYEDLHGEWSSKFYMQYSFPPFSVGEVGRVGAPGRREVGHGKLAERSLKAILPKTEDFPYVIRLESNITESNGSSSMASVCGGCLAMMDAGVPIIAPVSGIAMGLILEGDKVVILSDILGIEDSLGDMDFKVAGNKEGITAFQLDIKVEGITLDIMREALLQAKVGRNEILDIMIKACPLSKKELSAYAPRIEHIQVKQSKIGLIIGPGGKMIRSIVEETGVQVDINDEGIVSLVSNDAAAMEKAKKIILELVAEIEVGKTYTGPVTSVMPFGVFVEVLPGKEGLCHISELDKERVNDIHEYIKAGTVITVKALEINEKGQVRLSRRALL
ncbi:MAG: polyribonucleotide nucleotidyltransferase [Chlamydiae bacterium]|nr:polyribonucleotide nucleotidyltransferase [Chlamydiota bacterium]